MRPTINIPMSRDMKSLDTLLNEGYNQTQIVDYYREFDISVSRATIQNRIKELRV